MKTLYRHALVLGKYLPPHLGHLALIRFAKGCAERVTVLVEQRPDEGIAVEQRCAWLREALANDAGIDVIALMGDHPQAPPLDSAKAALFWQHWRQTLKAHAPTADVVVSGDDYGARLAQDLGIQWLPFDRQVLPYSATLFKSNPWENWRWLVAPARRDLLRRLVLVGPESTGKSSLAQQLASITAWPTLVIPEYAQHWLDRQSAPVTPLACDVFLTGQRAARHAWSSLADRWIIEDSHALTTGIWAARLGFDQVADRAFDIARRDRPHHVILTGAAGVPWVDASHRSRPDDREAFEADFRTRLDAWGWDYTPIEGVWEDRKRKAESARDACLKAWKEASWEDWAEHIPTPSFTGDSYAR